ncbi:MAG: CZB domain-containing protein [Campylobacterota bacterium]|nr:CZB domain-containing protein [Campylobacterota bacterium]
MNKEETIEAIANAKKAHENQMKKIVALLNGKEVENPTAVSKTECDFGKWLYADNNRLKEILGTLFYTNLETLHAKWHMEYSRLFAIFFKSKKRGFFSKAFGSNKVSDMEFDKAKLYYSELEATTKELLKAIASSQRRIEALNEGKFY